MLIRGLPADCYSARRASAGSGQRHATAVDSADKANPGRRSLLTLGSSTKTDVRSIRNVLVFRSISAPLLTNCICKRPPPEVDVAALRSLPAGFPQNLHRDI